MKNIYLTGYRASGKTSVGRMLAERLGLEFVDSDHVFTGRHGTVSDYVRGHGWEAFRDREAEIVRELAAEKGLVVSLGGGAVLRAENREALKNGVVVYLSASAETLAQRLSGDPDADQRPSLTGKTIVQEVEDVLVQRRGVYEECADYMISSELSLDEVLDSILKTLSLDKI